MIFRVTDFENKLISGSRALWNHCYMISELSALFCAWQVHTKFLSSKHNSSILSLITLFVLLFFSRSSFVFILILHTFTLQTFIDMYDMNNTIVKGASSVVCILAFLLSSSEYLGKLFNLSVLHFGSIILHVVGIRKKWTDR
jgi:hypothetical protein